jgi:hypothetical protein
MKLLLSYFREGGWHMAVFMVNYDLHQPTKNYDGVTKKIESFSDRKKALLSGYFINTPHTAEQVYNTIKPALDSDDLIAVTEITKNYFGILKKDVWEWLSARLK